MSDDEQLALLSRSPDDETEVKAPPPSADQAGNGSVKQGEHPLQNYLAQFVSIIGLFCLVTTGIVLSVGESPRGAVNNHVEPFTLAPHVAPTSPMENAQMESIGPENLERFLYIAMITGLLWIVVTLLCPPDFLIVQGNNNTGCSGPLDKKVLHLLLATLIFAFGAALLPIFNIFAYYSNAKCYRDEAWGYDQPEWIAYQICHFLFIFIQPLFFFKYVQHGAQLKFCRGLSHFVLMWLMGTNVSLWFHFLVEESGDEESSILVLKSPASGPTFGMNTYMIRPINITCQASSGLQGQFHEIRPFLQPFVLEYSLISAGLFLNLWNRIGEKHTQVQQTDGPPRQTTSLRIPLVGGLSLGVAVILVLIVITVFHYTKLNDLGIKTDICNNTVVETVKSELDTTFGLYYGYRIAISVIVLFGCLTILLSPIKQIIQGVETSGLLQSSPDTDPKHRGHIWIDTALLISSAAGVFLINGFGLAAAAGQVHQLLCLWIYFPLVHC